MLYQLANWFDDSGQDYSGGTISIEDMPFVGGAPAAGDSVVPVSSPNAGSFGIWVLGDVSNPAAVPVTRRADMPAGHTIVTGEMVVATVVKNTPNAKWVMAYATIGIPAATGVVGTDLIYFLPVRDLFLA